MESKSFKLVMCARCGYMHYECELIFGLCRACDQVLKSQILQDKVWRFVIEGIAAVQTDHDVPRGVVQQVCPIAV